MALAADLSSHLISAICYTLLYEERNDDTTIDEAGVDFPNGNQIGPVQDPEDPQSRLIGWGYRFRTPGTNDIPTIWIEQGSVFREATAYGRTEPPEFVNWMDSVAESRIDISDDTTSANEHVGPNGSSHGFDEESDQGGDVTPNT